MASLRFEANGWASFQVFLIDESTGRKKRTTIRSRITDKHEAELAKSRLQELIDANHDGNAPSKSATSWLNQQPARLRDRIEDAGIVPMRKERVEALRATRKAKQAKVDADAAKQAEEMNPTLKALTDRFLKTNRDRKASTIITYDNTIDNLHTFLGKAKRVKDITPQDAREFVTWLLTEGNRKNTADSEEGEADTTMAKNTVRRRTGIARQIFKTAIRMKVIVDNPFDGLSATVTANPEREHFITADDARECIKAAPDVQWKTIIALCRFGGLRNPSETISLSWDNIDTDCWKKMTILSPKTEHHEGGESREVPIFPHLLPYLKNAWAERQRLPESHRSNWVITRYRDRSQNMRTTFLKIIKRAGLKPWPKLFQNMRASCETDLLLATHGKVKAVAKWMGHSPEISLRHYQLLTDELEEMALADLKTAHYSGALGTGIEGYRRQSEPRLTQKPRKYAFLNVSDESEWAIQDSNL